MSSKSRTTKLIDIGTKTFISVLSLLFVLMICAIVLTYVLPKGTFGTTIQDGNEVVDYQTYIRLDNASGINIFKGLLSPFLILATNDGLSLIMLSIFLLVISGAFQTMNDCYGIKVFVNKVIERFKDKRFALLCAVALMFMLFGALLGLFEEMLTLLPIMAILAVSLGYDSFTGFMICIVACGFGFSSAITNPFTVIFASKIIGVNPLTNIWYRILIFLVMYGLLVLFIFMHTRKIIKNPESSLTYQKDLQIKDEIYKIEEIKNEKKILLSYSVFLLFALAVTIVCSSVAALRDYTVVFLIVVFLFGGFLCGLISTNFNFKQVSKSYLSGILSALPSIIFILMASSIKYILVEGNVLATITNKINELVQSGNVYLVSIILFAIILVLEFFISSSTAKAIFVMSILSVLTLGISKEMQVLIYTFADGYTNLLFPTSPVLLIGLSMIGVSYFKWLKKSWLLFVCTFSLVILFIILGVLIKF